MILYHGSNVKIAKIDLEMSNVGKDFGCGFYLTAYEQHALRQAQRRTAYTSDTYNKLTNLNTGLYFQSTAYVYSLLMQELKIEK